MMKRFSVILLTAALLVGFVACKDDENGDEEEQTATEKLEELAMNPEWINYATAATSELLDDCIQLWAAWNGPNNIPDKDLERIGADFFSKNPGLGSNGYGYILKNAGTGTSTAFTSQEDAIHTILVDGFANIANEVGEAKIGGPNAYAIGGDTERAVLEVESWYSWNSITDYSDNIVSIKNGYTGGIGAIDAPALPGSISYRVKSLDPALDEKVTTAIDDAYHSIQAMTYPFRSHLTGATVTTAIDACVSLAELIEGELLVALLGENVPDYNYSQILTIYTDNVVIPTYADLKAKAWTLYNAVNDLRLDPTNQTKLDAACAAWKAARIPWEQSEAILFGPASDDMLGLDPSMDSWPLDQEDIAGILQNKNLSTVDQFILAIGSENVRGFHTIELLLFKDGQNRKVKN
jgi:hypothetical protein